MILRPYQDTALADIRAALRQHRRVLFTAPTGSGKGVLVAFMMREAAKRGLRSWLVCHRRELLEQLSAGLWEVGVTHGVIAAGRTETKDEIQVASVQSLVRRLDRIDAPDFLVVDEAHHATAATYRKIMAKCERSWVVGLTATPVRLGGEGLDDMFDTLVCGPSVAELMAAGYLSPYRLIAPPSQIDLSGVHSRGGDYVTSELEGVVDRNVVMGDAVHHYRKYVAPQSCLVFCVSRKHARHVEEAYRAEGINAKYVGGDTPPAERKQAVADFKAGRLPVLTSCELFSEGVDSPGLRAVQLLRPTQSLGLYLQQVGRGLRIEPGKERCTILDHTGSCWRHGLPDDERDWTLEGARKRKAATETAPGIRVCEHCFAVYRLGLSVCPVCGAAPAKTEGRQGPEVVDGELQEIEAEEHRRRRRMEEGRAGADGLEGWVRLAIERGYEPAWAGIRHALRTRSDRNAAIRDARVLFRRLTQEEGVAV